MQLIVETGAGVTNANSYVSLVYADEYFASHPFYSDSWAELDSIRRRGLLVAATRQLDVLFVWYGYAKFKEQSLGFPRTHVPHHSLGYYLDTVLPERLKQATCETAYYMSKGDPFAASKSAGLDALKIDVIELQFSQSTKATPVPAPSLALLRGLGEYAFGRRSGKVLVG